MAEEEVQVRILDFQEVVKIHSGKGVDVNTINSIVLGEPPGSKQVKNVVSLSQVDYDAGTKIPTTAYIIEP